MDSTNNNYNKTLQPLANDLRKSMTKSEACLWKFVLKAKKMKGFQFRRQRPVLNYIVDFMCKELMLVIELDGGSHLFHDTQLKDLQKTNDLSSLGYTVLRFKDEEVLHTINSVIWIIEHTIDDILEKRQS